MYILTIILVFSALIVVNVNSQGSSTLTLYENIKFGGNSQTLTVNDGTCVNFNYWYNRFSSIKTQCDCVRVWDSLNCAGNSMVIAPSYGCHSNLGQCSRPGGTWNDNVRSISYCQLSACRKDYFEAMAENDMEGDKKIDISDHEIYDSTIKFYGVEQISLFL